VSRAPFAVFLLTAFAAALPAAAFASQTVSSQQPSPQTVAKPPAGQASAPASAAAPQAPAATTPAAQTPAGPPPPAVPAARRFESDAGIIFNVIKPDKGPDFESVMARVKEALARSDDPKKKQMALGWRVFKGVEAGPGGNLVYVFFFDPPVKDADYQITDILGEAFPNELQDLWAKFTQCFVSGQTMLSLNQVVNMSPNATTTPK
jgi:hypothetical protein